MKLERRRVVMLVTLSRVLAAAALLFAGANQWWGQAALLLAIGVTGNVADDRMAHNWNVNTRANYRLRSNANTLLAFCALSAAVLGGIWHWWAALLVVAWIVIRWCEPHVHGDWLAAARIVRPFGGLCVLVIAEAVYVHFALNIAYVVTCTVMMLVTAVLCYLERDRMYAFFSYALRVES